MGEIKDKYLEPLVGEPEAFREKIEIKKEDFIKKYPESEISQEKEKPFDFEKGGNVPEEERKKEIVGEKAERKQSFQTFSKSKGEIERIKKLEKKDQIDELCNLAFKDLDFAVEIARKLKSAYVLDEFHDSLVDKLYDKLVEKGKLKKF